MHAAVSTEPAFAPAPKPPDNISHSAPAASVSSSAAFSRVPAQTIKMSANFFRRRNSAVAPRFKNEAAKTIFAPVQARSARVPFVVVETIVLPRTFWRVYSRGELPRSKSIPPAENADAVAFAAKAKLPERAFFNFQQFLYGNFGDGNDFLRAVVQRRRKMCSSRRSTSNARRNTVPSKSRPASAANSAGVKRTSRFMRFLQRRMTAVRSTLDPFAALKPWT